MKWSVPAAAVVVSNRSGECVRVLVKGRFRGTVHAGETKCFDNVHEHGPTTIVAECEQDHHEVSRVHFHEDYSRYHFYVQ